MFIIIAKIGKFQIYDIHECSVLLCLLFFFVRALPNVLLRNKKT